MKKQLAQIKKNKVKKVWRGRWYYHLRNKTSGMNYLGQRVRNDVGTNYLGSGKRWKNHCLKHGGYVCENIEVVENIFFEEEEKAKKWLENKSKICYWKNDGWANDVPEDTNDSSLMSGEIQKKHATQNNLKRVESGTHPFLVQQRSSEDLSKTASETNQKLLNEGKHNFQDAQFQKMNAKRREEKRRQDGVHLLVEELKVLKENLNIRLPRNWHRKSKENLMILRNNIMKDAVSPTKEETTDGRGN